MCPACSIPFVDSAWSSMRHRQTYLLHYNRPAQSSCILFFFFSSTRPPPRSTLFPYPTLFRSRRALAHHLQGRGRQRRHHFRECQPRLRHRGRLAHRPRHHCRHPGHRALGAEQPRPRPQGSEEHTSELQSQPNPGCRLLLEKKTSSDSTPRTLHAWSISLKKLILAALNKLAAYLIISEVSRLHRTMGISKCASTHDRATSTV